MDPTDHGAPSPCFGDGSAPIAEPDLVLDELWERGERPDVRSFLDSWLGRGISLEGLLAVLRIDQRRRWLAGDRVNLHAYRHNFPFLDQNSEALFELLYHELLIREDLGEYPDSAEYARAFPGLAERLDLQLQIHEALSGEHAAIKVCHPSSHDGSNDSPTDQSGPPPARH